MPTPGAARRLAMLLVFCALLIASATANAQSTELQVTSVAVVDGKITISGKNFGGSPAVTLADAALSLTSSSDTEIVADLPAIGHGLYQLRVTRDGGSAPGTSAVTSIFIE